MSDVAFGARRPRPVAALPPADGEAVAKGWLLALIAAQPLRDAAALPTTDFARDAPALCAAVLRAVGSDGALGELHGLAPHAGALAGARGPAQVVAVVAALRAATWEALTLARLDAGTTAALAERLAYVCDAVAIEAVGGTASGCRARSRDRGEAGPARDREPRVHDDGGDWRAAIDRLVGAARPFALLAVEADDAARLAAADPARTADALARMEAAVRSELRPGDVLGREDDGRLWVVTADPGPERLAAAIAGAAPLKVSIGIAASPADGTDAAALTTHADERLFAARASGVPVA